MLSGGSVGEEALEDLLARLAVLVKQVTVH